jgi:hypothetical protein
MLSIVSIHPEKLPDHSGKQMPLRLGAIMLALFLFISGET